MRTRNLPVEESALHWAQTNPRLFTSFAASIFPDSKIISSRISVCPEGHVKLYLTKRQNVVIALIGPSPASPYWSNLPRRGLHLGRVKRELSGVEFLLFTARQVYRLVSSDAASVAIFLASAVMLTNFAWPFP